MKKTRMRKKTKTGPKTFYSFKEKESKVVNYKFTPYAYQKVIYLRDLGDTEVSFFCVVDENEPNVICDVQLVKQVGSVATTDMDGAGLTEYLSRMDDQGFSPGHCFRVWLHTHPGDSPEPSGTDWTQYEKLKTTYEYPWFAMLIISRTGKKFGRMFFSQGPGGESEVKWDVDWGYPGEEVIFEDWDEEYKTYVEVSKPKIVHAAPTKYAKGYEAIDWKKRWEDHHNHNYKDDWNGWDELDEVDQQKDLDFFSIDDLDEDEKDDLFQEISKKSIHKMTADEYEFYQSCLEDLNDE